MLPKETWQTILGPAHMAIQKTNRLHINSKKSMMPFWIMKTCPKADWLKSCTGHSQFQVLHEFTKKATDKKQIRLGQLQPNSGWQTPALCGTFFTRMISSTLLDEETTGELPQSQLNHRTFMHWSKGEFKWLTMLKTSRVNLKTQRSSCQNKTAHWTWQRIDLLKANCQRITTFSSPNQKLLKDGKKI